MVSITTGDRLFRDGMSGHSKWAQIKRQKGVADARRSARFTKLGHAIAQAARGGADPDSNFKLRLAIDRAKMANMPNDVIARAIQRGGGAGGESQLVEMTYEAYGPGGVALLITVLTDNKNRTASDVRHALTASGATLAAAGAVSWQFQLKGVLRVDREALPELPEELTLALIDAGADDVSTGAPGTTIIAPPDRFEAVRQTLAERGVSAADAGLESVPTSTVALAPALQAQLDAVTDALDALDDVQSVATNAREG